MNTALTLKIKMNIVLTESPLFVAEGGHPLTPNETTLVGPLYTNDSFISINCVDIGVTVGCNCSRIRYEYFAEHSRVPLGIVRVQPYSPTVHNVQCSALTLRPFNLETHKSPPLLKGLSPLYLRFHACDFYVHITSRLKLDNHVILR